MVLDRFGSGLNPGLYASIINNTDPRTWLDWTRVAMKYQQKYLLFRSALGMKPGNTTQKSRKKPQTPEQWKAAWNNKKGGDPDAMDTTPGRVKARKIDADERTELMRTGKCFTCKKQDISVAIVLRDLLNTPAPTPALVPPRRSKTLTATMKNWPK